MDAEIFGKDRLSAGRSDPFRITFADEGQACGPEFMQVWVEPTPGMGVFRGTRRISPKLSFQARQDLLLQYRDKYPGFPLPSLHLLLAR